MINLKKANSYFSKIQKQPNAQLKKLEVDEGKVWVFSPYVAIKMPADAITFNLATCAEMDDANQLIYPAANGIRALNTGLRYHELYNRQTLDLSLLYTADYFILVRTETLSLFSGANLYATGPYQMMHAYEDDELKGIICPFRSNQNLNTLFEPLLLTIKKTVGERAWRGVGD